MHARTTCDKVLGETKRFAPTVGVPSFAGKAVPARCVHRGGSRRFSAHRFEQCASLARAVPRRRMESFAGPSGPRQAATTHLYSGEDHAALVEVPGHRVRICDRAVDGSTSGSDHQRGVWHDLSPGLSGSLDARAAPEPAKLRRKRGSGPQR